MFERFTDRARRVVVLAQEEARDLNHNYIGTEHLLLGISREGEGVGARALASLGVSLVAIREQIVEIIGLGGTQPSGHIPFTPRAKKILELALREALQLGHDYIGTEHLLLGILREGEGVAAQVLQKHGLTLPLVRDTVVRILAGYTGEAVAAAGFRPIPGRAGHPRGDPSGQEEWRGQSDPQEPRCPNCWASLKQALSHWTVTVTEQGGEGTREVDLVFCDVCGRTIAGTVWPPDDGEVQPETGG
jgi:ATP-dependent Clp protease ATP-binding subunit ClpC